MHAAGKDMSEQFAERNIPYICTPLTGTSRDELLAELEAVLPKRPDIVEWRADHFQDITKTEEVLLTAEKLSHLCGEIPILFTIRSHREGGEDISLDEAAKVELLSEMCKSDFVQMIDYEVCNEAAHIHHLREVSKQYGKGLILSYHNFLATPNKVEICKHLLMAEFYGADAAKAAVMPRSNADVLVLLEATREAKEAMNIPIITISMGGLGAMSRLFGWMYGSALTFAVGENSSAPGQMPIDELRSIIANTKRSMET